jgi:hypothetical protein
MNGPPTRPFYPYINSKILEINKFNGFLEFYLRNFRNKTFCTGFKIFIQFALLIYDNNNKGSGFLFMFMQSTYMRSINKTRI